MHKIFIIGLLLFASMGLYAQETDAVETPEVKYDEKSERTPIHFNQERIDTFKEDDSFNYLELEVEENWWQRFKKWLGNLWREFWNWLFGAYEPGGFVAFMIRLIPYLIIFLVVGFVIWLFYKLNPGSRLLRSKEDPGVFFTEEEEIIRTKDIKRLIKKALDNKEYRLAVRYYYLLILKRLTDAQLIEYEFDKTNSDYIREISSEGIGQNFIKATNLYDYIWYGNFEVTETDYYKAQSTFTNLESQIPHTID